MRNVRIGMLMMVCAVAQAETVAYWKFQDRAVGNYADMLDNAANPGNLVAVGQANGSGTVKPLFSAEVPGNKIYSGRFNGALVNATNTASLYFTPKSTGWDAANNFYNTTEGSYVRVTNNPALWLTNLTIECFVKIDKKSRFSLVVGMQRTSLPGIGATWGMDETPEGLVKVRYDVQETNYSGTANSAGWNNGLPGKLVDDGKWHHLAFTYCWTNRQTKYYVDYTLWQSGTAVSNLQYTTTDPLLIGGFGGGSARIFSGWIDEVRYSEAVLSPDEFLSTNAVADTDTLYWDFESQPFLCKDFPMMTMNTNYLYTTTTYPVISDTVWSNQTRFITQGKQSFSYWNTNNAHSVLFYAPPPGTVITGGQLVASGKYHPTNFTVEAMVKVRSMTSWPLIVGKVRESGSPTFSLSIASDGMLRTRFDCYTNTPVWPGSLPLADRPVGFNWVLPSTAAVTNGDWYHVAFSYSNQVVRMYCNYKQVASSTTPYPIVMTDGDFNIGYGAGEQALNGWVDEVRITPRVLDPSQFLYTMCFSGTVINVR